MAGEPPKDLLDWLGLRAAPDFLRARPLGALFGVVLLALFLLALMAAVMVLVQTLFQASNPASPGPNLGAGALIAALLGAPFVIWGTWLRHRSLRTQQEGHMTDRISKAVEQLGAEKTVKVRVQGPDGDKTAEETRPNIEVRIGALLSLERIAQDSTTNDKGRDHVRVMEILCAYIRENAPASRAEPSPVAEWEALPQNATREQIAARRGQRREMFGDFWDGLLQTWVEGLKPPRADIQIALNVIGRRSAGQRRVEAAWPDPPGETTVWPFDTPCPHLPDEPDDAPSSATALADYEDKLDDWRDHIGTYKGYRLDLRNTNLQAADLAAKRPDASDAFFAGALLQNTRLEGASISEARLEGADLSRARMEGADLGWARLEGASLRSARMEGASLGQAQLEGASLEWARMEGAFLRSARLEGASLRQARMEGADLSWARTKGADLGWARLEGASLDWARMEGASFRWARMEGANLREARMEGAAVQAVNWSDTTVSQTQVQSMFGDASVILPPGLSRPAHWPVWQLPSIGKNSFGGEWRKWRDDPAGYVPPPPAGPTGG